MGEVRNQQLSHSLMTGLQMDEMIARIALNQGATPQTKTYLTDALGSVIAIAKADQSLDVGYAYSPYGQTSKSAPKLALSVPCKDCAIHCLSDLLAMSRRLAASASVKPYSSTSLMACSLNSAVKIRLGMRVK